MIGWTAFQRVLSTANYDKYIAPSSVQALSLEMVDAIDRSWKRADRKQV